MVTDVLVGVDRIMLTAYNPSSPVTLLKCRFVLELLNRMGRIPEEKFREWLQAVPGGAKMAQMLEEGWQPPRKVDTSVDPRNAAEEARIVAFLVAEGRAQCAAGPKRR